MPVERAEPTGTDGRAGDIGAPREVREKVRVAAVADHGRKRIGRDAGRLADVLAHPLELRPVAAAR
jgi:hypothetical protein